MKRKVFSFSTLFLILSIFLPFSSLAFAERKVDVGVLSEAISENRKRVDEFRVIEEAARELNLRVWLFGGTASGYAHYVKANLNNPQADFDFSRIYRSTQDADLVVDGTVEDAERLEAKIKEKMSYLQGAKDSFEVRLLRKPRTLNGVEREPLLNDPNFSNQNSDSHSLGLIELTKSDEPVVRDLKQWKEQPRAPTFLKDAAEGKLTFYKSPKHKETRFYKEGKNPEIFSAIRALTKAFQYDLEISPEAYKEIEDIVKRFDVKKDLNPQNTNRFNKLGLSMMLHASNLELAAETLDKLGLRKKLIKLSDPTDRSQMGFWLSKEPLQSKPIGQGEGRTLKQIAEELKIPWEEFTLSHETDSLLSYESMTRDRKGAPNVYISRGTNQQGETAVHGDGFYTRIGKEGARGSGYTIRFKPDPNAREGEDFKMAGDYLILKNKAALEVIPESFDMSLSEYFEKLSHEDFDKADKALVEFLKRRMGRRLQRETNPDEAVRAYEIVKSKLKSPRISDQAKYRIFRGWFSLPVSEKMTEKEFMEGLMKNGSSYAWVDHVLNQPHWKDRPELVKALIDKGTADRNIAEHVLSQPHWKDHPELVKALIDKGTVDRDIARYVLSQPHWKDHPEFVKALIDRGTADDWIAMFVLSQPHWKDYPEFVKALIDRGTADRDIAWDVLSRVHWKWKDHPEWVKALLERGTVDSAIAQFIIKEGMWLDYPEWIDTLIQRGTADKEIVSFVINKYRWGGNPHLLDWVEQLVLRGQDSEYLLDIVLENPTLNRNKKTIETFFYSNRAVNNWDYFEKIARHILSQPHWNTDPDGFNHPLSHWISLDLWGKRTNEVDPDVIRFIQDKVEQKMRRPEALEEMREAFQKYVEGDPNWLKSRQAAFWFALPRSTEIIEAHEFINNFIDKGTDFEVWQLMQFLFRMPNWKDNLELIQKILDRANRDKRDRFLIETFIEKVLTMPGREKYPELVKKVIDEGEVSLTRKIIEHVLVRPAWKDHPELVRKIIDQRNDDLSWALIKNVLRLPHWNEHPELVEALIESGHNYINLEHLIFQPHWSDHPELVEKLLEKRGASRNLLYSVPKHPQWKTNRKIAELIFNNYLADQDVYYLEAVFEHIQSNPDWKDNPELWHLTLAQCMDRQLLVNESYAFKNEALRQSFKASIEREISRIIRQPTAQKEIEEIFHKRVQPLLTGAGKVILWKSDHFIGWWFSFPLSAKVTEAMETLLEGIQKGTVDEAIARRYVLSQPHWKEHPYFQELLQKHGIAGGVSVENLRKAFRAEEEKAKSIKTSTAATCAEIFSKVGGAR